MSNDFMSKQAAFIYRFLSFLLLALVAADLLLAAEPAPFIVAKGLAVKPFATDQH